MPTDDRIRELAQTALALHIPTSGLAESVERAIRTALTEQREEDARDAARYRWLRQKVCVIGKPYLADEWAGGGVFEFVNLPSVPQVGPNSACALDAAIDAARRQK